MDQVVCLRDDWGHRAFLREWPRAGGVYTVREIIRCARGRPYYRLEEIVNPLSLSSGVEPIFNGEWFRSVRRTDIAVLKDLEIPTREYA